MASSINIPLLLQRYTPEIILVLISTFLEWTIVALLFLCCSLFFLITRFASICGLQTPCISCSLSAFKLSFDTIICNDHATQLSRFKRSAQRKKKGTDTRGYDYIIYGPPWKVIEYAENGTAIHTRIKRGSETECCSVVKEGCHKPDSIEDNSLEIMHSRCIANQERRIPVELTDKITTEDSMSREKRCKEELVRRGSVHEDINIADYGKTKLRKDISRDSISSAENYHLRNDHVGENINPSQNTHSYSSLSELIETTEISNPPSPKINEPIKTTTISNPSSPKINELKKSKPSIYFSSSKSLDSSLVEGGKENTHRGIFHCQSLNNSTSKSIFEITPLETTSLANPAIAPEPKSDNHGEFDASFVEGDQEEMKEEILIKLDESLEEFQAEMSSITEKINQLVEQKHLIAHNEVQATENVIKEGKPNFQSLAHIFNRDMNYSTFDLVSLGQGQDQRMDANLKKKKLQPSLLGLSSKKRVDDSLQMHKIDDDMKKYEKLAIQGEIDKLNERLENVHEARKLINQCVKSLNEGVVGISAAQEVLMQVASLK